MIPIKLALRVEGKYWNAYLISDEDPKLLGSILMELVKDHSEFKEAFMILMSSAFEANTYKETGEAMSLDGSFSKAPENERSGNA